MSTDEKCGLTDEIAAIADVLSERYGLDALYVYGSVAAGAQRSDSDLDLAALLRTSPRPSERLSLIADLSACAGRPVDFVELDRVSPILAMQILRRGRRVLTADATRAAEVEARIPSQYADLKRVRASAERALIRWAQGG